MVEVGGVRMKNWELEVIEKLLNKKLIGFSL